MMYSVYLLANLLMKMYAIFPLYTYTTCIFLYVNYIRSSLRFMIIINNWKCKGNSSNLLEKYFLSSHLFILIQNVFFYASSIVFFTWLIRK